MIGQVIKGRLRIHDKVEAGTFATAYLDRNLDANEIVTAKVLSTQFAAHFRYVNHFQRQAMLAQRSQHPNIVRILDYSVEQGTRLSVIEFVEGLTLDKVIQ